VNSVAPKLSIIVARASNGAIGLNNGLPWRLPEDLAHFKRTTMGKPIIMGRKTFESIGRVLPGRRNVVVTRNAAWSHAGVDRVGSIAEALALCAEADEVFVIGGAQLYADALPLAARIVLTEIHEAHEADAFLPAFDASTWHEASRDAHTSASGLKFDIVELQRR
jgi:dihydrofolate reductase